MLSPRLILISVVDLNLRHDIHFNLNVDLNLNLLFQTNSSHDVCNIIRRETRAFRRLLAIVDVTKGR